MPLAFEIRTRELARSCRGSSHPSPLIWVSSPITTISLEIPRQIEGTASSHRSRHSRSTCPWSPMLIEIISRGRAAGSFHCEATLTSGQSVRGLVRNFRRFGFGRGNNPGTIRVPFDDSLRFSVPASPRKSLKFQIKVLCHGRGREFESRRPRHIFKHLQQNQKKIWVRLGPISLRSTPPAAHSLEPILERALQHQLLNES